MTDATSLPTTQDEHPDDERFWEYNEWLGLRATENTAWIAAQEDEEAYRSYPRRLARLQELDLKFGE